MLSDITLEAWQRESTTLAGLAAYGDRAFTVVPQDNGDAFRVRGTSVTSHFFGVMGVAPAVGRFFTTEDMQGNLSVVISYRFWQQRLAGRADAIGKALSVDGQSLVIAGVTPEGFGFPDRDRDLYVPMTITLARTTGGERRVQPFWYRQVAARRHGEPGGD